MRYPIECYQMWDLIAQYLPHLRPAQRKGLGLWVYGTILAHSACQNAVVGALSALGSFNTLRQYLREWLYDGPDKACPCQTEVEVTRCFAPLLAWVLSWWQGQQIALAIDVTTHHDRLTALAVSLLYRSSAIPLAWCILPGNQKGAWVEPIVEMLGRLEVAMPSHLQVLVMIDRGLRSPRLWKAICELGWHPLVRQSKNTHFRPWGGQRQAAISLVPGPGHAWVGEGSAFKLRARRRPSTLVVVWAQGEKEPWVLLTDLAPGQVGVWWYSLRVWVELGFRALKGLGWKWEHTRRLDPQRVSRHWLVMALATLWVMAYGTRVEDAALRGLPPARLHQPPSLGRACLPGAKARRPASVFSLGLSWLAQQMLKGRMWSRLWLRPEPWPEAPPGIHICYHHPT